MTANEFKMDCHYDIYSQTDIWEISVRDGSMKSEFSVYDEDIQETVKENFEYFMDTAAKEFADRVLNLWDEGKITDREKQGFLDILRMVIG